MGDSFRRWLQRGAERLVELPRARFAVFSLLLLASIVLLAYAPAFGRWFFRDDFFLLHFSRYNWTFRQPLRFVTDTHNGLFTPLANLVFYLQYMLFGFSASGYRLVSLALHTLNAGLVGLFTLTLSRSRGAALLAAALFAASFAVQEAVSWIAASAHLLSLTFLLLALIFAARWIHLHFRRDLLLSTGLLLPGLLVKEDALMAPLVLIALVLLANRRRLLTRHDLRAALLYYGVPGILYAGWLLYWHTRPGSLVQIGQFAVGLHAPANYRYLIGLVIPPPDYIPLVALINRLLPGVFLRLYSIVGWALLAPLAVFLLWRLWKGSLLEQTAVALIVLTFAPFSMSTIGISMRYLYMPYAGFAIVLALAVWRQLEAKWSLWGPALVVVFLAANLAGIWVWNLHQSRDTAEKRAIIQTLVQEYDAGLVNKKQICVLGLPRAISDVTIAVPVFTSRQPRPEVYMDAVYCPDGAFLYQYALGEVHMLEP